MTLDLEKLKNWAEIQQCTYMRYINAISLDPIVEGLCFVCERDSLSFLLERPPQFLDSTLDLKTKLDSLGFYDDVTGLLHVSKIEDLNEFINILYKLKEILGDQKLYYQLDIKVPEVCKFIEFRLGYIDKRQLQFKLDYRRNSFYLRCGYLCTSDKERLEKFKDNLQKSFSLIEFIYKIFGKDKGYLLRVCSDMGLQISSCKDEKRYVGVEFDPNLGTLCLVNYNYFPISRTKQYSLEEKDVYDKVEQFIKSFGAINYD